MKNPDKGKARRRAESRWRDAGKGAESQAEPPPSAGEHLAFASFQNISTGTSGIRITENNATAFDLISLQLDTRDTGAGGTVTITGLKADGVTTVEQVVTLDTLFSLETFTLSGAFTNLLRVDIVGPVNFQFNDIVLRDVPQPAGDYLL